MKDRQPTQVLSNGAIRYGFYNADGTLNHYEYLKRDDAPTEEGTPLNKANLLSDATAAKIWPGAATRPEDPTVNDALFKLAKGTSEVGDITITARTDLSSAWLPCDGRTVSQEQYPSLCAVLRTPDSPAIWTEKTVSTNIGAGGDALSYENGHWFRTYRDATSAHILVSDDGETWTEWAMPQNLWVGETILSSRVVECYKIHYYNGLFVCSALIAYTTGTGEHYGWAILFADALLGRFRADTPEPCDTTESFTDGVHDIYFDGENFFVCGQHADESGGTQVGFRYTMQLTSKASPAAGTSANSQWWGMAPNTWASDIKTLYVHIRRTDNLPMRFVKMPESGDTGYFCAYGYYYPDGVIAKAKTLYSTNLHRNDEQIYYDGFFEIGADVFFWGPCEGTYGLERCIHKITGVKTLADEQITSNATEPEYAENCNGQIVAVKGTSLYISEDITQGWDFTATLSTAAGNQPAAAGTIVRIPCSSNGAVVKDIMHNFAYDNKKIPNITTDARSKAYIKALEE